MVKKNLPNAGSPELGNDGESFVIGSADSGNSDIGGIPVTDPANASGGSAGDAAPSGDGPTKRGRGRPSGSASGKSSASKTSIASSVKGIEKILASMHMMAANFTGVVELEIDSEEAKMLAESVADVASHYNVAADAKTMAWVGLA